MQSKAKTVDEYLAEIPAERRTALSTLRTLIKSSAPNAEEGMLYGVPTYTLEELFCSFASQKHYMALYCCDDIPEKYRSQLGQLNCGKSCIRFRRLEELPLEVISALLRDVANLRMKRAK